MCGPFDDRLRVLPLARSTFTVPQVCAQLIWEHAGRVTVDFTPGAGMFLKASLLLGAKSMAVCHNSDHIATLSNILKKYIRTQIEANQAQGAVLTQ